MARPAGILKINGTLGDLSFYDSVYGPIVRRKGGPSREQIKKAASCVRIREHNSEFKNLAAAGKLFRQSLRDLLKKTRDHRLVWRVTQLMSRIKNADTVSARGKRHVAKGLQTPEGMGFMKGFDLNSNAPLKKILIKNYKVKAQTRQIIIDDLVPARDLRSPKGATHVRLKAALLRADFKKEKTELLQSPEIKLALNKKSNNIVLVMNAPAQNTGTDLYLLQVEFLQEVNKTEYPLENGGYNCLGIVEVG
jgi:hypothetical protein